MLKIVSRIVLLASVLFPASLAAAQDWNEEGGPFRNRASQGAVSASSKMTSGSGRIDHLLRKKGVRRGANVFIRVFKTENVLELWMKRNQRYTLVKTYPICKWSGSLGPKQKQGDRQAPEGFYHVSKGAMNPNSKYHLSFNLGYPNRYDRAFRRTGSYLMIHGDCRSVGCYAMTDPAIEEIYGVMTAAFNNGQRKIPVHAFPFRMTATNIDKHSRNRWTDFWWNLKQGYDVFEATLTPPESQACGKNYTFTPPPLNAPGIKNPSWSCMMTGVASNNQPDNPQNSMYTASSGVGRF